MLNNAQKIILIASGAAAALAIKTRIDTKRNAKKRAKVLATIREIDACFEAFTKVNERVLNGEYRGKPASAIKDDFEFEQIAILEK